MNVDLNELVIENNEALGQFEARLGHELAVVAYKRRGNIIIFTHTEVPKAIERHGIAGRMARVALDYARAQHLVVVPFCPFVAAYVRRHPEYQDLVRPAYRTSR